MKIRITRKKLEILFVIVYFLIAVFCLAFRGKSCFFASLAGFFVGLGDWYVMKVMSFKWMRRGRFSLAENFLRYLLVGFSIWLLFRMRLEVIGIVLGLSVIPASLVVLSIAAVFADSVTVDD